VIDILPVDETDPVATAKGLLEELKLHSSTLYEKERWLVLNKTDLMLDEELDEHCQTIIDGLNWTRNLNAGL